MIKKSLYIMAVLFSTVQVHSMSLNEALGSSDIEVKFNRNGRISYTNTTINEKKYIDGKDYLFENNTYFIPSNTLELLTNTKGGGDSNLSFLASIKGKANISLQYLQSNNNLPDSIVFSGNNSKYKGTLYLHPAIKNISFTKKDSVISNISSNIVIPNKIYIPNSNNNKTLKNINIKDGSNILIKSSNQSNDVININENLENNKKTTLKNTKKIVLRQAATVEEEQSDQQPLSINDIFNIDGPNSNTLFSIYNLLNSILNNTQDEEKKQEILSNVIDNINKMNQETVSNINNMNNSELYHLCNILGKLLPEQTTLDILFNISNVSDKNNTLYWISNVLDKLSSDNVTTEVLSNISKMNTETLYWLSDVLSKLQSDTSIKEILFNTLNNKTNDTDDGVDGKVDLQTQINEINDKIGEIKKECEGEEESIVPLQEQINTLDNQINNTDNGLANRIKKLEENGENEAVDENKLVNLMKSNTNIQNVMKDIIYKNIVITLHNSLTFNKNHVDARKRLWSLCCVLCNEPICKFEVVKTYDRYIPTITYNGTIDDLISKATNCDINLSCKKCYNMSQSSIILDPSSILKYQEYISEKNCVYTGNNKSGYFGTYDLYCNKCGYHTSSINHGEKDLLKDGYTILSNLLSGTTSCTKCNTPFNNDTFANTIKQATIMFFPYSHKDAYCNFITHRSDYNGGNFISIITDGYPNTEEGYPCFTSDPGTYIQAIKEKYIGKICDGGVDTFSFYKLCSCGARWVSAIYSNAEQNWTYVDVDDCTLQD